MTHSQLHDDGALYVARYRLTCRPEGFPVAFRVTVCGRLHGPGGGWQELIRASRRGNLAGVLRIVANAQNLDLHAVDHKGKTAMQYAVARNREDVVQALVRATLTLYFFFGSSFPVLWLLPR